MTFYVGKRPEPDKILYQIKLYLPKKLLFFIDFGQQSHRKMLHCINMSNLDKICWPQKISKVGEAGK